MLYYWRDPSGLAVLRKRLDPTTFVHGGDGFAYEPVLAETQYNDFACRANVGNTEPLLPSS